MGTVDQILREVVECDIADFVRSEEHWPCYPDTLLLDIINRVRKHTIDEAVKVVKTLDRCRVGGAYKGTEELANDIEIAIWKLKT